MILKEADSREHDLSTLQKLLTSTIEASTRKRIEREIWNIQAGLSGERSAAHFLDRDFSEGTKVGVFHDLRIPDGHGGFAQIDHVMIHRIQGTAWVLETKNYSGRLVCDEWGDWSAWYGRLRKPIESPIEQARRHAVTLERWFKDQGIDSIKRFIPVVLMSPSSNFSRKNVPEGAVVLKSDQFHRWWTEQSDKLSVGAVFGMIGRYAVNGMSEDDMRGLGRRLRHAHVPASYDWEKRFAAPDEYVDDETGRAPTSTTTRRFGHAVETARTIAENIPDGAASRLAGFAAKKVVGRIPVVGGLATKAIAHGVSMIGSGDVQTRHGPIRLNELEGGDVAIRHAPNENLSTAVKEACRGRARWNPRYRNWIVPADRLDDVLAALQ